jgi:hypothetical protein
VLGKNLGFHIHHLEATIGIWELSEKIDAWAIRLVECQVPLFEFYFEKNGMEDIIQQMPIHDMA